MKKIISIALLLFITGAHWAVGQNRKVNLQENLPFEEVLKQAQKENKFIFLDFGSITCKPCLYIKQHVLTVDSVADFINKRFVSVDYNLGKEKDRLRKLYHVVGEPVLLILDQKGTLMHRMAGKMEANEILPRFRQGLDTKNNLVALNKQYENGNREGQFILKYLETLFIANDIEIKNRVTSEYLAGPVENLRKKEYFDVWHRYDENILSREMLYVFDNREEFYELFGQAKIDTKIRRLYSGKVRSYLYGHNPPSEDPNYYTLLQYLQNTDFPEASEWLVYLWPAETKYKDWVEMAERVNTAYAFNIIKGKSGDLFKEMMITQYEMYCNTPDGLQYAVKWCDDLKEGADQEYLAKLDKRKGFLANKIERVKKEKPEEIIWTDGSEK